MAAYGEICMAAAMARKGSPVRARSWAWPDSSREARNWRAAPSAEAKLAGMRGCSAILAALALALLPARAIAAPQDLAATHAYIQANYQLARAMVARIGPAQAKIERLNGNLSRACPHIGIGSPETEASQPVAHEVAAALWSVAYGTAAGPIRTFVQTARPLLWSNGRITGIAQRYARSLHEMASLPLPDLCKHVRSWKASGFQVIPSAAVNLANRVDAIELTPVPPRLLAPYVRGADASLLTHTQRLETKLEENEFIVGQTDWIQVLETLGLNE